MTAKSLRRLEIQVEEALLRFDYRKVAELKKELKKELKGTK